MAIDIGPKIGLDGEAEFRKNLQNINQMLKTLGSEMKAVTSAFTENDDAQAALTAQAGVLTRQIETQEKKVQELKKGYEAAAKQLGENTDIVRFNGETKVGDPQNWRADISLLKKIGYEKKMDLTEGIREYVGWVKQQA